LRRRIPSDSRSRVAEIVVEQLRTEHGPCGRVKDAVVELAARDSRHEPKLAWGPAATTGSRVFRRTLCFEQ